MPRQDVFVPYLLPSHVKYYLNSQNISPFKEPISYSSLRESCDIRFSREIVEFIKRIVDFTRQAVNFSIRYHKNLVNNNDSVN